MNTATLDEKATTVRSLLTAPEGIHREWTIREVSEATGYTMNPSREALSALVAAGAVRRKDWLGTPYRFQALPRTVKRPECLRGSGVERWDCRCETCAAECRDKPHLGHSDPDEMASFKYAGPDDQPWYFQPTI